MTQLFNPTPVPTARVVNPQRKPIAIGKAFESLVECSQNDSQGPVCVLVKVKNYAKRVKASPDWTRRTGEGYKLVEERSPFDFAGSVWGKGTAIFFDCKSCGPQKASLATNQEDFVKKHQIRALRRLADAKAFAGFLVECHRMQDYRWLWAEDADLNKPVRWDDPRWFILGPIKPGFAVPLRKLFEAYK